ncbi:hypothetical protein [Neosynechococcus sphagnicola]|uniref:hypothetical protein n=1 Tax=Neosynechococcus sphagnicola TaxID=1501145 RepID=UPI0005626B7B|nr:hypothetical protein [Neosynechococcus sphagnicola]
MDAHTFNSDVTSCPFCRRVSTAHPNQVLSGLLVCPSCQQHLVVSWSGHYVRDPFTFRRLAPERMLRRQSQPFVRLLRDFGFTRNTSLLTFASGTLFLGLVAAVCGGWVTFRNPLPSLGSPQPEPSSLVHPAL